MENKSKVILINGVMLEVFSNGTVWQPGQNLADGRVLKSRWCGQQSKKDSSRKSKCNLRPQYRLIEIYPSKHRRVKCRVHRLIACAFLGMDYDSDLQVDHINCIKDDNRVENLRVVTQEEHNRLWTEEQSVPSKEGSVK